MLGVIRTWWIQEHDFYHREERALAQDSVGSLGVALDGGWHGREMMEKKKKTGKQLIGCCCEIASVILKGHSIKASLIRSVSLGRRILGGRCVVRGVRGP